ncbi:DUF1203 domain-containing protein [Paragemmobacter ruber]|uniref:DUF1203 domain-containing protein n=1 Tax=Paragemmobacter ruber TaxID=1985673 RepID=A0ABW9Y514_9RHOB|nr:DUF1203 domain-containing protein [Rhodobacter ruber]NBE07626.1 DUF1203 domain-containing protein [Rhodobacter ruber]
MLRFVPIPTGIARHYQAGGVDSYGLLPESKVSDGGGNPCRHCLRMIPEGKGMLVLAHRPFGSVQPYAETGPIFLCAQGCDAGGGADVPEILASPDYIVRGYGADERIVYGTGGVVATGDIPARAAALLALPEVDFVHVRSARNNCFQLRVERG